MIRSTTMRPFSWQNRRNVRVRLNVLGWMTLKATSLGGQFSKDDYRCFNVLPRSREHELGVPAQDKVGTARRDRWEGRILSFNKESWALGWEAKTLQRKD